jgi:hypothetical protein
MKLEEIKVIKEMIDWEGLRALISERIGQDVEIEVGIKN